ncbi:putative pyridoxine 5'-phosphate oxidase superfamily flavin-nucleotide-binding protein [Streptomyces griseochromogenes]|uniref:Pyridoxamine 5-phosphate oxidase n=1 Tax=Streptomyces griseochromogenes TaxID=68214 RepID=A0A1B1B8C0_9ACTN|nr:pyridoxamine 5'-phosphate oxidase family protein [Streptomyces griseochromogenes]ANP55080.1 pyridoxamine 5-phosphate oxidase [Streptomyces griseochromogenes]MBP2050501.1 putative pyridoxine 5'-phosphate oxidase superfamily flavin-nucleotide-binding protein [Streptomyces griseochromogenes]
MGIYHAGSLAVQEEMGVRDRADHVGRSLGQDIKPVAAAFLEMQPLLVVGAADPESGRVWASALTGAPGFVRATGPRQMSVMTNTGHDSRPEGARGGVRHAADAAWARATTDHPHPNDGLLLTDPLAAALKTPGTHLGTIALDPRTRRRMRLNGRLRPTARGFAVVADQVFSNCPKYIQRREAYETVGGRTPGTARRTNRLSSTAAELVQAADTFFLATVHSGGADVSHRGGNPGFVRATSPHELTWPDYPGNAMFLTLGNLRTDPRAGVLFLDWESGTTLQLTGEAYTEFGPGGERTVRFAVTEVLERAEALPLRWSAPRYSPANP